MVVVGSPRVTTCESLLVGIAGRDVRSGAADGSMALPMRGLRGGGRGTRRFDRLLGFFPTGGEVRADIQVVLRAGIACGPL